MPYTTAQKRLKGDVDIGQILASANSRERMPAAQEEIAGIMREAHKLTPAAEDDFTVRNQTEIAQAIGEHHEHDVGAARGDRVDLAARGRHRHHEHHAGVGDGANARDRHPHGDRCARLATCSTQFLVESVVMSVLGGIVGLALPAMAARRCSGT